MEFGNIPILPGLAARLNFLAARTNVIAQNVANADTPDYVARDLEAPKFGQMAEQARLRVDDARHIAASPSQSSSPGGNHRVTSAPDGDASLTGNQVSLETQAMKLAGTRSEFALATSVYRKGLDMLRIAVRG